MTIVHDDPISVLLKKAISTLSFIGLVEVVIIFLSQLIKFVHVLVFVWMPKRFGWQFTLLGEFGINRFVVLWPYLSPI